MGDSKVYWGSLLSPAQAQAQTLALASSIGYPRVYWVIVGDSGI